MNGWKLQEKIKINYKLKLKVKIFQEFPIKKIFLDIFTGIFWFTVLDRIFFNSFSWSAAECVKKDTVES